MLSLFKRILRSDLKIRQIVENAQKENRIGQFVLPKSVLVDKGIITLETIVGKRVFRVYPYWDTPTNKQANKTQQW